MNNPFTAEGASWVSPSMNRVSIVELPGLDLPDQVKGRTAHDLLSTVALIRLIRQWATDLPLGPNDANILYAFDRCFTAPDPLVRARAREVALEYGRRLGYVLLTLKRGDPVNQAVRTEWNVSHWRYWGSIETVWLGGGLVSGRLGPVAAQEAQSVLRRAGYPGYQVQVSPFGGALPMVGATRYASTASGAVLSFDFGHTHINRACGLLQDGVVVALRRFSDHDAPCRESAAGDDSVASLERQVQQMLASIAETWSEAKQLGLNPGSEIIICLACYLYRGHPYPMIRGCYTRLQRLTDNLQQFLTTEISQRLASPVTVQLVADGLAAATTYAGAERTAVLMFGTSMGIGFPPLAQGLRSLGAQLEVVD